MDTPSNFLQQMVPETVTQAVAQHGIGRPKLMAKAAFMTYLASFLDQRGINRHLLQAAAPGIAGMYDAGQTPEDPSPRRRRLALARLFENIEAELPTVLITDNGATLRPPGIGGYDRTIMSDKDPKLAIMQHTVIAEIGFTITIGAEDPTTLDDIASAVGIFLGPMLRAAGGDRISDGYLTATGDTPGINWVLMLPMEGVQVPPANFVPHGEDPRQGYYTTSISVDGAIFEASTYSEYNPWGAVETVEAIHEEGPYFTLETLTLRLGERKDLGLAKWPAGARIYSTDRRVVSVQNGVTAVARGLGTSLVRLVMPGAQGQLAEMQVTVTR